MAGGDPWTTREDVIAVYFISREAYGCADVASEVITLRCNTSRTPRKCQNRVALIRTKFGTHNLPDPRGTEGWDRDVVGKWLPTQMIKEGLNKEGLEDLLGVKSGEIKDEKVQEIVNKKIAENARERIDWKLRLPS